MANNSLTGNNAAGHASLTFGIENPGALKRHHYLFNNSNTFSSSTNLASFLPGWKILNLKVSKEAPVKAIVKFRLTGNQSVCGFTHGFPYQALLNNSTTASIDAFTNNVASCINYGWGRAVNYGSNFYIFNGRGISASVAANDSIELSIELNNGVVIYYQQGVEVLRSTYQQGVDFYLIASVTSGSTVTNLEISGASGFTINDFSVNNFEKEIWIPCQEVLDTEPRKPGSQFNSSRNATSRTNIQVRAVAGTTIDVIYPNGIRNYTFSTENWYTIPSKAGDNFAEIFNNFSIGIKFTGNYNLSNLTGLRIANPQYATQTSLNLPNSVTGYQTKLTNLRELEIWGIAQELSGTDARKVSYNATTVGLLPRLSSLTTLFLDSTCDINDVNAAFSSGTFSNLTKLTFFDIRGRRDDIVKSYPEFCALRSLTWLEINLSNAQTCANSSGNVSAGNIPSTLTNVNDAGITLIGMTTLENFRGLYRSNRSTTTTGLIINGNLTERQANELIIAQISVKMLYGEVLTDSNLTYVHRLNSPGYQLNHELYYAYNKSRFQLTDIQLANGTTGTSSNATNININTSFFSMLTGYTYKLNVGGVLRDISSISGNTVTVTAAFGSTPSPGTAWTITGTVTLGDRVVLANDSSSVTLYIAKSGGNPDDFNVSRNSYGRNFIAGRLLVISTSDPSTHYNARQLFRMSAVTANANFLPVVIESLSVSSQTHFRWEITLEAPKKSISLTNVNITGSTANGDVLTVTAAAGSNLATEIAKIAIGDTAATSIPALPLGSSVIPSIVINKTDTSFTIQKGNISGDITTSSSINMTVCYGFSITGTTGNSGNYYVDTFKSSGNRIAQSRNSTVTTSWSINTTNTDGLVFSTIPGLFYDNFSSNAISGFTLG